MAIVILAAGVVGFIENNNDPNFVRNGQDHYLELRAYLSDKNNECQDVIWMDRDNRRAFDRILPMYIRSPFGRLIWYGELKFH